jgi:hypothetical protein
MYFILTYIQHVHNAYCVHIPPHPNAYVYICMYFMYLYVSVCTYINPFWNIHTDTFRYIQYIQIHASKGYIQIHQYKYRYIHNITYTNDVNRYIQILLKNMLYIQNEYIIHAMHTDTDTYIPVSVCMTFYVLVCMICLYVSDCICMCVLDVYVCTFTLRLASDSA